MLDWISLARPASSPPSYEDTCQAKDVICNSVYRAHCAQFCLLVSTLSPGTQAFATRSAPKLGRLVSRSIGHHAKQNQRFISRCVGMEIEVACRWIACPSVKILAAILRNSESSSKIARPHHVMLAKLLDRVSGRRNDASNESEMELDHAVRNNRHSTLTYTAYNTWRLSTGMLIVEQGRHHLHA